MSKAPAATAATATRMRRPMRRCSRRQSAGRCACSGCAQDEHGWDPKGPPTLIDLRAALDAEGNVIAWESEFFIPERPRSVQRAAGGGGARRAAARDQSLAPGNVIQNSASPTHSRTSRRSCHRLRNTPFRPSWIRTPGRMQNTFANECFIDEIAAAAGADPFEFRLRYLDRTRAARAARARSRRSRNGRARPSPAEAARGDVAARPRRQLRQI